MSDTPLSTDEGFGCRATAIAFGLILGFVVGAAVIGVSVALRPECTGLCETAGFSLYAAALPISAVFAAVAGDLPVAWPLDATFWIITAFGVGRIAERRRIAITRVTTWVVGVALLYGFAVSFFIASVTG